MTSGRVTITSEGHPKTARVNLDGRDITRALRRVSLDLRHDDAPQITLELVVAETVSVTGGSMLYVADESRDLLIAFGWTPPAEVTP